MEKEQRESLLDELDRLNRELEWQMSHKRIDEIQARIDEIEHTLDSNPPDLNL